MAISNHRRGGGAARKVQGGGMVYAMLRWMMLLFAGYYLGSLQSSYYLASTHHEEQQKQRILPNIPVQEQKQPVDQSSESVVERNIHAVPGDKGRIVEPKPQVEVPSETKEEKKAWPTGLEHKQGVCQLLSAGSPFMPSALELFFRYYKSIHEASQLSTKDTNYKFSDFTAELLYLITPRLPQSTMSLPRQWSIVRRILNTAEKRLDYLQHPRKYPKNNIPPPVKIVLLGGSVLVGRNCRKIVRDYGLTQDLGMQMPNRECTYSFRLQLFLDQLTHLLLFPDKDLPTGKASYNHLPQLFSVSKIAMGGTNTNVGSEIFKYDLVPDEAHQADIVLNAYATNDMHVLTILEMEAQHKTLREGVFDMLQDFVRNILRPNACHDDKTGQVHDRRPLLLHMDDYLGNEQRGILQTMELSQSVLALSQYYGFGSMSYSNVVRDWVYGDSKEYWFSPEGWWRSTPDAKKPSIDETEMQREIHPGMGMHIAASWIVSYNLLNIATTFCSMEQYLDEQDETSDVLLDYQSSSWASNFVPLENELPPAPGRPHRLPYGLPPPLTPQLMLDNVTQQWQSQELPLPMSCGHMERRRCPFSWVSGLSLQQNNKTWIQDAFQSATAKGSKPWKLVDEGGKIGFLAQHQPSRWILEFSSPQQQLATVTFFFLKSYGEKWKDSKVAIEVQTSRGDSNWTPLIPSTELLGTHAKNTSEMYTEEMTFAPIPPNQKLQLNIELVGGSTFKLMGLAICAP